MGEALAAEMIGFGSSEDARGGFTALQGKRAPESGGR